MSNLPTLFLYFSRGKTCYIRFPGGFMCRWDSLVGLCQTSELPSEWSIEQIVGSDQLATSKFEELARHCYRGAERGG